VAAQEAKEMCVIASDHCLQQQEGLHGTKLCAVEAIPGETFEAFR
jgi:hypothetical protein